ncbi:MAG: hypothetical protein AAF228_13635 [Pseudomonadota bacterium]
MRPFYSEQLVDRSVRQQDHQSCYFAEPYREAITGLANHSHAFNDLLRSFPCVLFALATGFGEVEKRKTAYHLIENGAALKTIAKALNIPWWMRKLPPEAFTEPLQALLPESSKFCRSIVNYIPQDPKNIASWLHKVCRASQLCGEAFALWVAEHEAIYAGYNSASKDDSCLELLAAWSWYSQNPDAPAHHLITALWHPNIGLSKAIEAAKSWYNRVKLIIYLGDKGIEDNWLQSGSMLGFDIIPLKTAEDFLIEAEMMGNCLDQYADQVCFQRVRVFSVRQNGTPVANLEIGPHEDDRSMPTLEQLRGPQNARVSPLVWRAAYAWMGSQDFTSRGDGPMWCSDVKKDIQNHPIWSPYCHVLSQRNIAAYELALLNLDEAETLLLQLNGLALLDGV